MRLIPGITVAFPKMHHRSLAKPSLKLLSRNSSPYSGQFDLTCLIIGSMDGLMAAEHFLADRRSAAADFSWTI